MLKGTLKYTSGYPEKGDRFPIVLFSDKLLSMRASEFQSHAGLYCGRNALPECRSMAYTPYKLIIPSLFF